MAASEITKTCPGCGTEFLCSGAHEARRKYCANECAKRHLGQLHRGSGHPRWIGGRGVDHRGYVLVCVGSGRRQYEHRVVMEAALGRKLGRQEVVHHINGIRGDNRLENLELMPLGEHTTHHCTIGKDPSIYLEWACVTCGKKFHRYLCHIVNPKRPFCSRDCYQRGATRNAKGVFANVD